jgi:glc operon protein GlcG
MTDTLTLDAAQTIVARAIEKALSDFKRPICVSVCDEYGFLLAFARMNGAPVRSIQISQRKAYTAARMGVSTDAFLARIQKENIQASYFGEDMVPLPGGNVLKDASGKQLGAVGISGLALHEDQAIAEAMVSFISSSKV